MRIIHVALRNFGPHEGLSLDFEHGLVGVFGANGSGKSTVVDGIYAALTNDWSRFAGVKAGNIRDSAGDKEKSYILVKAEHDGVEFQIERSLRPNRSTLEVGGRKVTKDDEIRRVLEDQLGVDKWLIATYVFVPQWGMFDFLSQTPGERAKTYQHLCGTGKAQEIHDAIGALLESDASFSVEVVDNSDELNQKLREHRSALKTAQGALSEAMAKRASDEEVRAYEELIQQDRRKRSLANRITDDTRQMRQKNEEVLEQDRQRATWKNLEDSSSKLVTAAEEEASDLESLLEDIDKALNIRSAIRKADDDVAGLKDDEPKTPDEPEEYKILAALHRKHAELEHQLAEDDKFLALMESGEANCPVCGTPTSELAESASEARKRVEDNQEALASVNEKIHLVQAYQRDVIKWRDTMARWQPKMAQAQAERDRLPKSLSDVLVPKGDRNQIESDLNDAHKDLAQQKKNLVQARDERQSAHDAFVRAKAEADQLKSQIAVSRKEHDGINVSKAEVDEAVQLMEDQNAIAKDIGRCEQRVESEDGSVVEYEDQLKKLTEKLDRQKRLTVLAGTLRKVREVFHRQALPAVVAQANLAGLEQDINETLELFGSPFWVEASQDLSFDVHFSGEPARTAERLSGGQKGVLAVAFRTAVGALFGADVGMMTMDEPTAGMDADNVAFLAEALSQYAGKVRGRRQVILITHSDELRSSFDQVIDLSHGR